MESVTALLAVIFQIYPWLLADSWWMWSGKWPNFLWTLSSSAVALRSSSWHPRLLH